MRGRFFNDKKHFVNVLKLQKYAQSRTTFVSFLKTAVAFVKNIRLRAEGKNTVLETTTYA